MKRNPLALDEEELRILRDFEQGEFESIQNVRQEKRRLESTSRQALRESKRVNIRLSAADLERIRKRASIEGMPYQTLIASTLHKFATGQLKETKEIGKSR